MRRRGRRRQRKRRKKRNKEEKEAGVSRSQLESRGLTLRRSRGEEEGK